MGKSSTAMIKFFLCRKFTYSHKTTYLILINNVYCKLSQIFVSIVHAKFILQCLCLHSGNSSGLIIHKSIHIDISNSLRAHRTMKKYILRGLGAFEKHKLKI